MKTDNTTPSHDDSTAKSRSFARWIGSLVRRRRVQRAGDDALILPPMTRGMQAFAILMFFAFGVALTWFVVANPFDLSFLPRRAVQTAAQEPGAQAAPATLYQCPMHPEVIESEPGVCPICEMDLVEVRGSAGVEPGEREVLYWYAPMDPTYVRDEPGLSPMGMELVPKYADAGPGSNEGVIRIDPVQVQNIGVVSATAELADIARFSRTVGILDFNADRITWVNTKFEGWVEKAHVTYVGEEVRPGDPLFEIYSPELVTTQEEYLRALEYRDSLRGSGRPDTERQAESLVRATRDRLEYWDITNEQIEALEASRQVQRLLTVSSPADGVVTEVMSESLEGMFVKPGMNLYRIADLSSVWVHADIYELDIPWIRAGQPAEVSFRNDPGRRFRGKILFLYPEVSRDTRTLKICVEVPNPGQRLRPGMYADVIVHGPPVTGAVVVPQSSVIHSGERNIVFVSLGDGRFEPREVSIGVKGEEDRVQITEGVTAGESVVTQAQFMLDSESRIQEAIAKFRQRAQHGDTPADRPPQGGHVH